MHTDGRWHTAPRRVIYAAEHPALAMIESLAHMRLSIEAIPTTLQLIAIDMADDASFSAIPRLPKQWQTKPAQTQASGNAWLDSLAALVLPVPSAIVPHARNVLINTAHDQAAACLVEAWVEPLRIDPRFLR